MAKGDKSKGTTAARNRKTVAPKGETGGTARKVTGTSRPAASAPARAARSAGGSPGRTAPARAGGKRPGMTSRTAGTTTAARTPSTRMKPGR